MVALRRQTQLPLDDCLYALQPTIPNLTRSSLHRCLQRHNISRLPDLTGDKPANKKFRAYPIGYFHVDIAVASTAEARLYLFVAVDRTSKFDFAELHADQTRDTACGFLRRLITVVPYRIHVVLTDNGIEITNRQKGKRAFKHPFDRVYAQHDIEHRLTKVNHLWTNGQVEITGENDFVVGLQSQLGLRLKQRRGNSARAVGAEICVERPVGVDPRDDKTLETRSCGFGGDDDFVVGLNDKVARRVESVLNTEVKRSAAVVVECRIKRSV